MTLLESISAAGGLLSRGGPGAGGAEDLADLRHSFVVRDGQLLPVDFDRLIKQGDMSQNIYLQPDDFVYVPSAVSGEVYVLGAVRVPRPLRTAEAATLISAVANVGGTIKDAYITHVGIVRGSLSQPKIAEVNYKAIVRGKPRRAPPASGHRLRAFQSLQESRQIHGPHSHHFARAVAINEGARAVGDFGRSASTSALA